MQQPLYYFTMHLVFEIGNPVNIHSPDFKLSKLKDQRSMIYNNQG